LGTLVPVIGLVQVGDQVMADRYAYIPLVGILVMIAWGFADWADSLDVGVAARMIPAACILLALSMVTHRQLSYWASNQDLWTHALAVTDKNFIAHDNLGGALLLLDKPDEAYAHFQAAAEINPRDPMCRSNLAAYLQEHGHLDEAIEQHKRVLSLTSDPGLLAMTYANLGTAYRALGRRTSAGKLRPRAAAQFQPAQYLSGPRSTAGKAEQTGGSDQQLFARGRAASDRSRISASGSCPRERGTSSRGAGSLPAGVENLTRYGRSAACGG